MVNDQEEWSSGTLVQHGNIAVKAFHVSKQYGSGENAVQALNDVSVDIIEGELTAIIGASGSGKSTFLHTVAGLDDVTSGESWISGVRVQDLRKNASKQARFRRKMIGFVFQQHGLVPVLTVRENILLPESLNRETPDKQYAMNIIKRMGLEDRLDHLPNQLSGGQRQKTAMARVLIQCPEVVFADEPTGSLDMESGRNVLDLIRHELVDRLGITVIMVTHSIDAALMADRVLALRDGSIILDTREPTRAMLEEAVSVTEHPTTRDSNHDINDEHKDDTKHVHDVQDDGEGIHDDGRVTTNHLAVEEPVTVTDDGPVAYASESVSINPFTAHDGGTR